MNSKDIERTKELIIDEWIWILFIILSILNISGDELEKSYCYYHIDKEKTKAKNIFTLTVFVSFLIYVYLAHKNCNKYIKAKYNNQDTSLISARCLGSILVVIASSLFLTAQLKDTKATNPSIQ